MMAYLDSVQAPLASLQELQSQTGEELDALSSSPCGIQSVLDRAFKGELWLCRCDEPQTASVVSRRSNPQ